mmetsp:Transcript_87395/g.154679  ORF Transcript_87395/g.154679 Transcript_87395/m.154679 type:complete len:249 (-) Transcript_87395:263-1009(-)
MVDVGLGPQQLGRDIVLDSLMQRLHILSPRSSSFAVCHDEEGHASTHCREQAIKACTLRRHYKHVLFRVGLDETKRALAPVESASQPRGSWGIGHVLNWQRTPHESIPEIAVQLRLWRLQMSSKGQMIPWHDLGNTCSLGNHGGTSPTASLGISCVQLSINIFRPRSPSLPIYSHGIGNPRANRWKCISEAHALRWHHKHIFFTRVLFDESKVPIDGSHSACLPAVDIQGRLRWRRGLLSLLQTLQLT